MRNAKIEDIEINDESYHHANNTNDRTSMMMYSTIGQILTEASKLDSSSILNKFVKSITLLPKKS